MCLFVLFLEAPLTPRAACRSVKRRLPKPDQNKIAPRWRIVVRGAFEAALFARSVAMPGASEDGRHNKLSGVPHLHSHLIGLRCLRKRRRRNTSTRRTKLAARLETRLRLRTCQEAAL